MPVNTRRRSNLHPSYLASSPEATITIDEEPASRNHVVKPRSTAKATTVENSADPEEEEGMRSVVASTAAAATPQRHHVARSYAEKRQELVTAVQAAMAELLKPQPKSGQSQSLQHSHHHHSSRHRTKVAFTLARYLSTSIRGSMDVDAGNSSFATSTPEMSNSQIMDVMRQYHLSATSAQTAWTVANAVQHYIGSKHLHAVDGYDKVLQTMDELIAKVRDAPRMIRSSSYSSVLSPPASFSTSPSKSMITRATCQSTKEPFSVPVTTARPPSKPPLPPSKTPSNKPIQALVSSNNTKPPTNVHRSNSTSNSSASVILPSHPTTSSSSSDATTKPSITSASSAPPSSRPRAPSEVDADLSAKLSSSPLPSVIVVGAASNNNNNTSISSAASNGTPNSRKRIRSSSSSSNSNGSGNDLARMSPTTLSEATEGGVDHTTSNTTKRRRTASGN